MDIRQYQGSQKYLKAADLKSQSVTCTISEAVEEEVGVGKDMEKKPVLHFTGKDKGLVLNTTNGNTIAETLGFEAADWVGKQIELFPDKTLLGGNLVDCIRCRVPVATAATVASSAPVATAAAPMAVAPAGDEVPF